MNFNDLDSAVAWSYIAGFFDGEGSCGYYPRKTRRIAMDYLELAKFIVSGKSYTISCKFCHNLYNFAQVPELMGACQDCWHEVQDYLTERGFTIIPLQSGTRHFLKEMEKHTED